MQQYQCWYFLKSFPVLDTLILVFMGAPVSLVTSYVPRSASAPGELGMLVTLSVGQGEVKAIDLTPLVGPLCF